MMVISEFLIFEEKDYICWTDGAARGNPGKAGAGVIIKDKTGKEIKSIHKFLGIKTNNQAEYIALILALEQLVLLNPDSIEIKLDSQMVVNQMNGKYQVRNKNLKSLYEKAIFLKSKLKKVNIEHVYRKDNSEADALANKGIDNRY